MKILVTGGAGFIGSHIVDAYLARGDAVAVLDNFVTGLRANLNPQATLFEVDLTDRTAVARAIEQFRPQLINHQAAHLSVYQSVDDPWYNARVNIDGLLNLMEPAVKNGLRRIVAASSGGVMYGDEAPKPTPEIYPGQPVSPYGVSKLAMEAYLHYYGVQYQIPWVSLRYANVYGPRQNPKGETGVVSVFLDRMMTAKHLPAEAQAKVGPTINGDGEQTRDYVYVDDVVAANLAATASGQGIYNVGTGIETNVNDVFSFLQTAMDTTFPEQHGPPRPGEQRRSVLDAKKAERELGWQPTVDLAKGIEQTVAWYKESVGPRPNPLSSGAALAAPKPEAEGGRDLPRHNLTDVGGKREEYANSWH